MRRLGYAFSIVLITALAVIAFDARATGKLVRDGALAGNTLIQDPSVGPLNCAQGAVSSTCLCGGAEVSSGFCCWGVAQATQCFLIDEDANTVSHVYWNGSALVDTKGLSWSMTGTVPQVAAAYPRPAGAGPYVLNTQFYGLAAPNAVNNVAGADFSACVVFWKATGLGGSVFAAGGAGVPSNGWNLFHGAATCVIQNNTGSVSATADTGVGSGVVHVVCGGVSGANGVVKCDGKAANSAALTLIANTVVSTRIGQRLASGACDGTIYEIWVSTTTASDALFTSIMSSVKTKLGITAW